LINGALQRRQPPTLAGERQAPNICAWLPAPTGAAIACRSSSSAQPCCRRRSC